MNGPNPSPTDDLARFLGAAPAHLQALRQVREQLDRDPEDGSEAAARLGGFLHGEAVRVGLSEVAEAAVGMLEPEPQEVVEAARRLESLLEERMAGAKGARILLVEDEPTTAQLLEHTLQDQGHRVVLAKTGREARRLAAAERPEVVILDLGLPDVDGRLLIMELRRQEGTRRTPLVVLSGKIGAGVKAECFAYGADVFLDKPVDPTTLSGAVTSLVERYRMAPPPSDPLGSLPGLDEANRVFRGFQKANEEAVVALLEVVVADSQALAGGSAAHAGDSDGEGEAVRGRTVRELLREVVVRLTPLIPPEGLLAQWSMAELLLLVPGRTSSDVVEELEAVREAMEQGGGAFSAAVRLTPSGADLLEVVGELDTLLDGAQGRIVDGGFRGEAEASAHPTVLVVEDDPVTAGLLRHHLERTGLKVAHEENGKEAYSRIQESPPDLVVLDLQLPGMNGLEVLARLQDSGRLAKTKVVILTSLAADESVSRAFQLGADDYVVKPFSPGQFMARILRLLRHG